MTKTLRMNFSFARLARICIITNPGNSSKYSLSGIAQPLKVKLRSLREVYFKF